MNETKVVIDNSITQGAVTGAEYKGGTEARSDSQVRYLGGSRGGRLLSSRGGSEGWCSLDFPLLDVRELTRS